MLAHFPTGKTGAKTAASTLYRSSKLRLAAFMTEGGLAAVVAAAAKTRGIGCKGDLVRVFLFRSHVVTRQKISRHTLPTPGGQVEISPYFLETRMQSGRRPFDNIIHRYWTGYLGISRSSRGVNFDRHSRFTRLDGFSTKNFAGPRG